MTPSTALTLQGFLQGLQSNMMGLVGSLVAILVILFVSRWLIGRAHANGMNDNDARSVRGFANKVAALAAVLVLVGFAVSAASYGTNAIPHSTLDRSTINDDMNANIKR